MVVALMAGVTKFTPVPKALPPLAAANQLRVPALAVADRVTVPAPHLSAGVVAVTDGVTFTVATTAVRAEIQLPDMAST